MPCKECKGEGQVTLFDKIHPCSYGCPIRGESKKVEPERPPLRAEDVWVRTSDSTLITTTDATTASTANFTITGTNASTTITGTNASTTNFTATSSTSDCLTFTNPGTATFTFDSTDGIATATPQGGAQGDLAVVGDHLLICTSPGNWRELAPMPTGSPFEDSRWRGIYEKLPSMLEDATPVQREWIKGLQALLDEAYGGSQT